MLQLFRAKPQLSASSSLPSRTVCTWSQRWVKLSNVLVVYMYKENRHVSLMFRWDVITQAVYRLLSRVNRGTTSWNELAFNLLAWFLPKLAYFRDVTFECTNPFSPNKIHTTGVLWWEKNPIQFGEPRCWPSRSIHTFTDKHISRVTLAHTVTFELINKYCFEMLAEGLRSVVQHSCLHKYG